MHGKESRVHIDNGAKKSLMSESTYQQLPTPLLELKPTRQKFRSYTKYPPQVVGKTCATLQHNGNNVEADMYVIKLDQRTLLSGDHLEKLGLIKTIHRVREKEHKDIEEMKTTGTLPGKYTNKIDPKVKPVVHGPRRQSPTLKKLIIDKLDEVVTEKAITKCDEPTDW